MTTSQRPILLCVDDEVRSLETLERTLDEEFDVLTANSADLALELLRSHDVQVILCDQRMPDRTGVELLTEVRDRCLRSPGLFCLAIPTQKTLSKASTKQVFCSTSPNPGTRKVC